MNRVERLEFTEPFKLASILCAGVVIGMLGGKIIYGPQMSPDNDPALSPAEMRSGLIARCVAAPDIISEIEQKLPDNSSGLITPAVVRKVLKDVVSKC